MIRFYYRAKVIFVTSLGGDRVQKLQVMEGIQEAQCN